MWRPNSPKIVNKYLAPSPATSKGRLKKQKLNVRMRQPKKKDTTNTQATKDTDKAPVPTSTNSNTNIIQDNHSTINVLCCTALWDATTGTFYTDLTGSLLVASLENMQAYFLAYECDTYTIFAKPCPYLKDDAIIAAYKEVFNELNTKGYTPKFNLLENQATAPIKVFLKTQGFKW